MNRGRGLGLGRLLAIAAIMCMAGGRPAAAAVVQQEWRHLDLEDVEIDLERFRPIRGRYLQVMYDMDGREESQFITFVHIGLDRVAHSGPWDGQLPATIEPLREPGLVINWLIQNALWNGFDRVLTDSRLSTKQRVMPGNFGLLVGTADDSTFTRVDTARPGSGDSVRVSEEPLDHGALNVLTAPYFLSAMDLQEGDRFTLPGYAMINGPGGGGIQWRGAYQVKSVTERLVKGRPTKVAELLFNRMDEINGLTVDQIDHTNPGHRTTRLLISPDPPYLLGRANILMNADGEYVFFREYLGLVDWAEQPLPLSDYLSEENWDLDLEAGVMRVSEDRIPQVLLPLLER